MAEEPITAAEIAAMKSDYASPPGPCPACGGARPEVTNGQGLYFYVCEEVVRRQREETGWDALDNWNERVAHASAGTHGRIGKKIDRRVLKLIASHERLEAKLNDIASRLHGPDVGRLLVRQAGPGERGE